MSEEESGKVANLEIEFQLNGYTAEADANKLLLGLGIPMEFHDKKMSTLALDLNCESSCSGLIWRSRYSTS